MRRLGPQQRAARKRSRHLAVVDSRPAVDEQFRHTSTQHFGIHISGPWSIGVGIEHHHIGEIAGPEIAAPVQMQK